MIQKINNKHLNELSVKERAYLAGWCYKEYGPDFEDMETVIWKEYETPLLTIGHLINFLYDHWNYCRVAVWKLETGDMWSIGNTTTHANFVDEELLRALWEGVKHEIRKTIEY